MACSNIILPDPPDECVDLYNLYTYKSIKVNIETMEVFDELDNFLGYAKFIEDNKVIVMKEKPK